MHGIENDKIPRYVEYKTSFEIVLNIKSMSSKCVQIHYEMSKKKSIHYIDMFSNEKVRIV